MGDWATGGVGHSTARGAGPVLARAAASLALALLLSPAARAGGGLAEAPAPTELKFAQFFKTPIGPRGLELSDSLRAADGQYVQVRGYIVVRELPQPGRFWLTARPLRLSEEADGEADDLPPNTLTVLLDPSQSDRLVQQQQGLVTLRGRLSVGRQEDARGRVSWVRLQLPPDALETQAQAGPSPASSPAPSPTLAAP